MNMNTARQTFEFIERSLAPDPTRVWDRRSPFHPTNRTASIESVAWLLLARDVGEDLQIDLVPIVAALFAERCSAP